MSHASSWDSQVAFWGFSRMGTVGFNGALMGFYGGLIGFFGWFDGILWWFDGILWWFDGEIHGKTIGKPSKNHGKIRN